MFDANTWIASRRWQGSNLTYSVILGCSVGCYQYWSSTLGLSSNSEMKILCHSFGQPFYSICRTRWHRVTHIAALNKLLGEPSSELQHSTPCCWGVSCHCRVSIHPVTCRNAARGGCWLSLMCVLIPHRCSNQQEMFNTCFDSNYWPSLNLKKR